MSLQLSSGALAQMCQGQDVLAPVLQVLGHKAIQGSGSERFRLLLSDGRYSNSFCMLATQLNNMIHEKQLEANTVVRLNKFQCNQQPGSNKRVVIILEVEVVSPGSIVGEKLGSPVTIGSDGVVPPPPSNQNSNPNIGAAVKRPIGGSGYGEPPIKTTAATVEQRSVLSARPGTGSCVPVTPIASITPYQNKWTIKARVTSKSDVRTWNKPSGSGKLFSMDLLDESGEIRVTAFKDQCDAFYDLAVVGKVYHISNCSVKAANKQYSKLNNEYELTFKDNGTMELAEDAGEIPTVTYNFACIADLASLNKESAPIDVIGVCKSVGDVTNLTTRDGRELVKREIQLVDKSSTEVALTLWGTTATNFQGSGFPIVAVKGAKVSDYNGVQLSGGDMLINPDLDLAHELKGWWDNEGSSAATTSLTVRGGAGGGIDQSKTKMIGEVKQENTGYGTEKGEYYSTTATITFFSKEKALYKACGEKLEENRECNKKVVENGDGSYRCEKCAKEKQEFKWRLMLQLNMADATSNQWASCFQEQAEKILGIDSQDLGRLLETDEERYNAVFLENTFKTFNFRMRAKADTYNDETRMKHTIVSVEEINHAVWIKQMIKEVEAAGVPIPHKVNKSDYM